MAESFDPDAQDEITHLTALCKQKHPQSHDQPIQTQDEPSEIREKRDR